MVLDLIWLALGGALLYFGAEWLVRGAAGAAVRLGVRPLLIGLTIVSYATSAPELAVSVSASLRHQSALVLGNVVGSNITNIALILGLSALIAPPHNDGSMAHKELWVLLGSAFAPVLFLWDDHFSRLEGLLLIAGAVLFTFWTMTWSKSRNVELDEVVTTETRSLKVLSLIGLLGLACLVAGGDCFVRGAVGIAREFSIDERIIGLTVVALGTSVPELAASLVAAVRGHSDIAIGNVVGSNVFNALLILGTSATIDPFRAPLSGLTIDFGFMIPLTLYVVVALWTSRRVTRLEGGLLFSCYLGFIAVLVTQVGRSAH